MHWRGSERDLRLDGCRRLAAPAQPAFQSGPGGYFVHTEWYVPGFEATTLGVMIGPDFALSVIYAAGDSPPLPCPPKE